jgi:hypothetical protein
LERISFSKSKAMNYSKNFLLGAVDMPQDGAEIVLPNEPTYTPPHLRTDSTNLSNASGRTYIVNSAGGAVVSPPAPPINPPVPPAPPANASDLSSGDKPNLGDAPVPADSEGTENGGGADQSTTSSLMKYLPYAAGAALLYFLFLRKK